jgi:hypothetical protein
MLTTTTLMVAIQRRQLNGPSARSGQRNLKHLHPPAQLWLRLDQSRTATAQGAVPPAQPLPQALHLPLSGAQPRFRTLPFIGQSCLVYVWHFPRILLTLRDRLQDVPKPGPLTKIAHPVSTWSFIHGTVGLAMTSRYIKLGSDHRPWNRHRKYGGRGHHKYGG